MPENPFFFPSLHNYMTLTSRRHPVTHTPPLTPWSTIPFNMCPVPFGQHQTLHWNLTPSIRHIYWSTSSILNPKGRSYTQDTDRKTPRTKLLVVHNSWVCYLSMVYWIFHLFIFRNSKKYVTHLEFCCDLESILLCWAYWLKE
jgi:hypothetical protein